MCAPSVLACTLLAGGALAVPQVAYEHNEGGPGNGMNSPHVSKHGTGGPVLADDFIPVLTGNVTSVTWWGSAPLVPGAVDQWEITFHTDTGGVPTATLPNGGVSQHYVFAGGIDPDGDGVWEYTAAWAPQDMNIVAGNNYWFSVANFVQGWTWAYAGTPLPQIGAEMFAAVVSTGVGPNGGPHFGPWVLVPVGEPGQDFAFRIDIPAPAGSIALMGIGLLVGVRRRRR